jgi:threonine synthase
MNKNIILKCSDCNSKLQVGNYICPNEDGILEVQYEYNKVDSINSIKGSKPGIWKYSKLLPNLKNPISLGEGGTPLIESRKIGPEMNIQMYFKNEGQNPTGSFKDRAASVMLSVEKDLKHDTVITVSSGNASGAIACYSAAVDIQCNIFMCKLTHEKLINTSSYWPKVFIVEAEVGDALKLAEESSLKFGWEILNTTAYHNPFTIEGYKSISFELYEQNGLPNVVVCPMGSGSLILGIWKGFYELYNLGITNSMPRIIGTQSEGCNPIYKAYIQGKENITRVQSPYTIAGGIGNDNPGVTGKVALRRIKETNGAVVQVSDNEILKILGRLPKEEGVFGGPTGVVSVAGAIKALDEKYIKEGENVVCIISESGFKDLNSIESGIEKPIKIEPNLSSVENYVNLLKN